jgi:hypothetical protein
MKIRSWFSLAAIAAAGCGGYDAPSEVTNGQLVYTQPAPTTDNNPSAIFKPLNSYYLDPSLEVWKDGVQQLPQAVPSSTVSVITTRMGTFGYTQQTTNPPVGQTPNADVGLRLAYLQTTNTYYYSGGYCSIYWAYYYCYPGWAYAGSYTTGTVLIQMVDLRTGTGASPGRALWVSSLYAILGTAGLSNSGALNTALTRAFAQSPYLDTH